VKQRQLFEQPVIQTAQMFIGEMGCWLVVGIFSLYRRYNTNRSNTAGGDYQAVQSHDSDTVNADTASIRSTAPLNPTTKILYKDVEGRLPMQGYRVALLALPAVCDICGTTLMNVGFLFVVPSIYQMTRGALVIFVGFFSVVFLKKRLHLYQWFALVTVVLGVGIVGLAGAVYDETPKPVSTMAVIKEVTAHAVRDLQTPEAVKTIVGVLLIAGAQIFTATQFVLEEFILEKYALEPLKVVGWEGLFGFFVTFVGMIILHLTIGRTASGQYGYFDAVEGWREITSYRSIGISSILIMISIG
jgi:drug/metabolite transporter (DMT)-like permease